MHPYLFKIGIFSIYTYGFFVAIGFLAGILLARIEAKRLGRNIEKIMDLAFYVLIAAIIGSRCFYILTTPEVFIEDPWEIFRIWNGGLVFYGGFLAALVTGIFYLKKNRMPLWQTADIMAPSLAAGQFLGRLGCFSAGCCYGKHSDLPWAVVFTNSNSLAPLGISLHPTQLYHAAGNLLIFAFLWLYRKRKKFDGQLFWFYVLIYGAVRSFVEIFRGDSRGLTLFDKFSVSQTIGMTMAVIALVMLVVLGKKADKVVGTK